MTKKIFVLTKIKSWILLIFTAATLTMLMLILQQSSLRSLIAVSIKSDFLVETLNFWPVLLLMFAMYFLTDSCVLAIYTTSFPMIALSVINRYKMVYRQDPLLPWDFLLGAEFLGISKSLDKSLILWLAFALLAFVASGIFFFLVIKNEKIKVKFRLVGLIITIFAAYMLNETTYSDKEINVKLPVDGNVYFKMDEFNSKGFLYQFIYTINKSSLEKPLGYDKNYVASMNKKDFSLNISEELKSAKKPHVFLILGESFSEIAESDEINFDGFVDPLENFKKIKATSDDGTIIAPQSGGGTANTEFDILTGLNTKQFPSVSYSNVLITKDIDGLPFVLKQLGYKTQALHPGFPWFYNRQNVFKYFGFDSFVSGETFDPKDVKGMYIREDVTYDRIFSDFDKHVKTNPGVPLFEMVITIQNHGPYTGKYGVKQNFNSNVPLTKEDIDALSNYFEGQKDVDAQLKRFIETMENSPEPVVFIYFGDHYPSLSKATTDKLVKDEEKFKSLKLHKVPYFVWTNKAAQSMVDKGKMEGNLFSSFYLGASILEYLGFGEVSPFFKSLNDMKKNRPVILEEYYYSPDGLSHEITEEPDILEYKRWSYYKLFK